MNQANNPLPSEEGTIAYPNHFVHNLTDRACSQTLDGYRAFHNAAKSAGDGDLDKCALVGIVFFREC